MTGDINRLGDAVALLMDAEAMLNNQSEIAQRINAFLSTIHPAECVELPDPDGVRLRIIEAALRQFPAGHDIYATYSDWKEQLDKALVVVDTHVPQESE